MEVRAIRTGSTPEMSLERAIEDQRLMDQVYASIQSQQAAASEPAAFAAQRLGRPGASGAE